MGTAHCWKGTRGNPGKCCLAAPCPQQSVFLKNQTIFLLFLLQSSRTRPRRWIVTIPSLDQWLATIGNHWKTIVSNEKTIEKPSVPMVCQTQNHWKTIVSKGKTIEKPLVPMVGQTKTIEKPSLPMVCQTKNHWYRWLLSNHSFKGTSEYENLGVLQLKSQ